MGMCNKILKNFREVGFLGIKIKMYSILENKFREDRHIYLGVKKRVSPFAHEEEKYVNNIPLHRVENEDTIWVAWFQGEESMPELVKRCYKNLCEKEKNHRVRLITDENLSQYVDFPAHIIEKRKRDVIRIQQYSDIVRTALLYQNGGIWIDATMWLTEEVPEKIWNQDFFMFSYLLGDGYQIGSSQFIRANAGNQLLRTTLEWLYKYWERYDKMVSYYQWHFIIGEVFNSNDEYKKMIEKMPKYYAENNHALQIAFFDSYDKDQWEYLKRLTFIHKLTYKNLEKAKDTKGTFCEAFFNGELL